MTEQPGSAHEPDKRAPEAQRGGTPGSTPPDHVRTDGETAVDDAVGATDNPG